MWSPTIAGKIQLDLTRVTFYTTFVGSDEKREQLSATIASTSYMSKGSPISDSALRLIPRVFKKEKNTHKTRIVDIAITMDVMRTALLTDVDGLLLITGDGDFVSLVQEVTRTSKQIFVAAFSSGLNLRNVADRFIDLDGLFFE